MLILFINNTVVTMYIMLKSSVRKTDKNNVLTCTVTLQKT
jgi:hypothetical protein